MNLRQRVLYELRWCPQNMSALAARMQPDFFYAQIASMVEVLIDEDIVLRDGENHGGTFSLTNTGHIESLKSVHSWGDDDTTEDDGSQVIVYVVLVIFSFVAGALLTLLFTGGQ